MGHPFIAEICTSETVKTISNMIFTFLAKQNMEKNCSIVKAILFRMLNKSFWRGRGIQALEILYFVNTKWSKNKAMGSRRHSVKQAGIQQSFHPVESSNNYAVQCHSYSFPELLFSYMKYRLFKRRLIFTHSRVSYKPRVILSWDVEESSSSLCSKSRVKRVLVPALQHNR